MSAGGAGRGAASGASPDAGPPPEAARGAARPAAEAELRRLVGLRDRELRAEGLVLAEGRLVAGRLLAATGFAPRLLACVPSLAAEAEALAGGRCPLLVLPEPELAALAGFSFHRGMLALAERPRGGPAAGASLLEACEEARLGRPDGRGRVLLLPATRDPENLGALLRSAAAFGFGPVLLGPDSADRLSRRVLRVSMGAALSLSVLRLEGPAELEPLRAAGWRLAASVLDPRARPSPDWAPPERLVLAVGEEYRGLDPGWIESADELLTIPMAPGPDSLNAAAAGAVLMYAAAVGAAASAVAAAGAAD